MKYNGMISNDVWLGNKNHHIAIPLGELDKVIVKIKEIYQLSNDIIDDNELIDCIFSNIFHKPLQYTFSSPIDVSNEMTNSILFDPEGIYLEDKIYGLIPNELQAKRFIDNLYQEFITLIYHWSDKVYNTIMDNDVLSVPKSYFLDRCINGKHLYFTFNTEQLYR